MRLPALALLAVNLLACAAPQPHKASPTKPRPASTPSVPKQAPPAPATARIDPDNYQQEKERLRLALARKAGDSLAPGEVGYYMDVLQGRLRQIGNSQFGLAHEGSRIVVTLIGTNSDGTHVEPSLASMLTTLAKVLAEYRKTLVSVQAEAAGDGTRARGCAIQAVRALNKGGVPAQHIAVVGMGAAPTPTRDGDFSSCGTVVVQLEPIVRTD